MSNRTSKPVAPKGRITAFFKPRSHDINAIAIASSSPQQLPDHCPQRANTAENLATSMRNLQSRDSSPVVEAPLSNSSPNASMSSSSMPGPQTTPKQGRVIPSSDGEEESSEFEDSEDSDGLEDPRKMFSRLRRKNSATDPAPAVKKKNLRPKSPVRAAPIRAIKPPAYKFSLDSLVAQKAKSNALSQGILRSRALFEEANKEDVDSGCGNGDQPISEGMLEDAFGEGKGKRLLAALNRKDAWRIDKSWHFYDMDKGHKKSRKNLFPRQVLGSGWYSGLATVRGRQQNFLSGFVQDMAKIDAMLPDEIYMWMLDELCLEVREDLTYAYFNVLHTLPGPIIAKIVTESSISRMFSLLGGKDDALDTGKQIVLVKAERIGINPYCVSIFDSEMMLSLLLADDQEGNFYNTRLVTCFLGKVASIISSDLAVVKTVCALLVRLALDVRVAKEAEVRSSIEDSLAELFEKAPNDKWPEISQEIALNLINTIPDVPYRLRVLNTLPVHTPRAHLFRRRLALSYIFDDLSYLTHPYDSLVRISRFSDLLMKPQFKINKNTEYSDLQSLVSIMDIAIDDGPTAGSRGQNDAEVDVLVEHLRNMFSGIYDTNAQNLVRTEAKDTLERLVFRLRFAVRVKDKTNLVIETDKGPEWIGKDGKVQSKLPWGGGGSGAQGVKEGAEGRE